MPDKERLDQARSQTRQVYQTHAGQFDRDRNKSLFEKTCIDRFLETLPVGGSILDLGCGSGEPIAAYLIARGFNLTGIDYAPAMIELARSRFSDHQWHVQDMRRVQLTGLYNGVLSWNGFFHLNKDEQRSALPKLCERVARDGSIMLTVGPKESEVTGTVAGQTVYHASLGEAEYRALLTKSGFAQIQFSAEDPACDRHSILVARRS